MLTEEFKIGPWLVRPSLNSIAQNGKRTHLEPKAMEVLVCLAEHAGNVVSKEQLIQSVWADTFVTDYVLIRCISELRKALEDDSKVPHLIETIPKRGHRLVEKIEHIEPPAPATSEMRQPFSWTWLKARGPRRIIIT